jgi:spermidine synthase
VLTQPSWLAKIGSYFVPLKIWRGKSSINSTLELYYSQGAYMLCTQDACYSHGIHYNPFKLAFATYKKRAWPMPKSLLLLGGGLLSAAHTLYVRHNVITQLKAVELDSIIAQLAADVTPQIILDQTEIITGDAIAFIHQDNNTYDCIGIDIFLDMKNNAASIQTDFLKACNQRLAPNGKVIANVYLQDVPELAQYEKDFKALFTDVEIIAHQSNRIFIGGKQ